MGTDMRPGKARQSNGPRHPLHSDRRGGGREGRRGREGRKKGDEGEDEVIERPGRHLPTDGREEGEDEGLTQAIIASILPSLPPSFGVAWGREEKGGRVEEEGLTDEKEDRSGPGAFLQVEAEGGSGENEGEEGRRRGGGGLVGAAITAVGGA